jgi:hypothetical protein
MARAAEQGLQVNKPWGDSASYDFVIEHKRRFLRVQVKSTKYQEQRGGYRCGLMGNGRPYAKDAFDFLAAYVIPEDLWYIMPMEIVQGRRCVSLYPHYGKSKTGCYKEAWHLLRVSDTKSGKNSTAGPTKGRIDRIEACAAGLSMIDIHRAGDFWPHDLQNATLHKTSCNIDRCFAAENPWG